MSHAYSSIIEPGYVEMTQKFGPLVQATAMATEINVLCGLALRITRLAIASALLARRGLEAEGNILRRSAMEAFVNLGFIFYSGPKRPTKPSAMPEKNTRGLCLQFCAYADVAYHKLVSKDPKRVRESFKNQRGLSDAQYDVLSAEHTRLSEEALNLHGCKKSRWHSMTLQNMAELLLADPPPFLTEKVAQLILSDFVVPNSAVHVDALSLRSQYNDHGTNLMELVFRPDDLLGETIAVLAIDSWKAIGWYLKDLRWVEDMVARQFAILLQERASSSLAAKG